MDEAERLRRRQRSNIIVAKFIPPFLIAIVAYASWAFVGPLCVDYLINTPQDAGVEQRVSIGIALPIVYFFLLILMASAYLRLLLIVGFDPGYIPQRLASMDSLDKEAHSKDTKTTLRSCAPTTVVEEQGLMGLDYEGIIKQQVPPPPGTEDFYLKDAFVCDKNGLPMWCYTCGNWKPDRSHHSRDVGRCVSKMDHFCPWVGGMVGENGYKFFVQFNLHAVVFSLYTMIVMAYFVAEAQRKTGQVGNIHWVVTLGLGGFFTIFTFGLVITSIQLTFRNLTTVENIDAGKCTMFLAVLLPPELQSSSTLPPPPSTSRTETSSRSPNSELPLTSELDDPSHHSYFSNSGVTRPSRPPRPSRSRKRSKDDPAALIWQGTITYPLGPATDDSPELLKQRRIFAILRTPPGMNPWDLGVAANFRSVFGHRLDEWLLPLHRSPCTDHSNQISRYPLGWEFEQLLADARLVQPPIPMLDDGTTTLSRGRRSKKRRLAEGWQNGERPDGWVLEKEARRVRRGHREHHEHRQPSRE